jgi:hypothetical protein
VRPDDSELCGCPIHGQGFCRLVPGHPGEHSPNRKAPPMTDPTNPEPSDKPEPTDAETADLDRRCAELPDTLRETLWNEEFFGCYDHNVAVCDAYDAGRVFERSQAKEPVADDRCSFCEKTTREICQMIAGKSDARICDECVQTAVEIVLTTQRKQIMDAGKEAVRIPPVGEKGKGE